MNVLVGRERIVFDALAEEILARRAFRKERMRARARRSLARCTLFVQLFFRLSLLLFEWGTLFFRTGNGRFEQFTQLPPRARRRYMRLWMNHKVGIVRQSFLFLKLMVLASHYDDRKVSRRVGYAPKWLC